MYICSFFLRSEPICKETDTMHICPSRDSNPSLWSSSKENIWSPSQGPLFHLLPVLYTRQLIHFCIPIFDSFHRGELLHAGFQCRWQCTTCGHSRLAARYKETISRQWIEIFSSCSRELHYYGTISRDTNNICAKSFQGSICTSREFIIIIIISLVIS